MMENQTARTIKDVHGRVLLFSCEQFIQDICVGNCCFLCGASQSTTRFNKEHVIPRWVLDRYELFDKEITLSNGQPHTYGTYKVPCCQSCNTFLGREVETPVSQLLHGGHAAVAARLNPDTIKLLFTWLCLIFIKIHMKDRLLRMNCDRRLDSRMIADDYYWPDLHHVHAVARAPFTQATLDPGVIGSMVFLPIDDPTMKDLFDWVDLLDEKTIALRVDDLGIIAVLNDSCAAYLALSNRFAAIEGPITTTQMRELAALFAVANTAILNRPEFGTLVRRGPPLRVQLWATHDAIPRFGDFDPEHYGAALALVLRDRFDGLVIDGVSGADKVREKILTGKVSFLFDEEGKFMRDIRWVRKIEKPSLLSTTDEQCNSRLFRAK